ncbi:MAG TPA: hypothetical protein VFH78_01650 [Candidatus Thermoplasmatota archaeon]|nr:hypothetical protein [Candidatus Thermoplasmatota archaeon]
MKRLWWGVGLAFLLGAVASALLLADGPGFGRAPPDALLVRVTNEGPRDGNLTVHVGTSGSLARWTFELPAGGTEERRLEAPPREQVPVRVRVTWSAPAAQGDGFVTAIADGRDCPGGLLLAEFRVDTSTGVDFPLARARCQ